MSAPSSGLPYWLLEYPSATETPVWTAVTSEPNPGAIIFASINAMRSDSVLMIGGATYGPNPKPSGIWILSSDLQWTTPNVSFPIPINSHTTVIINSTAYIFGGSNLDLGDCLSTLYSLNVGDSGIVGEVGNITQTSPWPPARFEHTAVVVSVDNTQVMAIYGGAIPSAIFGDLWIFNPLTKLWKQLYNVPTCGGAFPHQAPQLTSHSAVALSPRKMVIIGGQNCYNLNMGTTFVFDFVLNYWTELFPTMGPAPVNSMSCGLAKDGSILLFGGGQPLLKMTPGCPSPNQSSSFPDQACEPCETGKFLYARRCIRCDEGLSTAGPGKTSADDCSVCDDDYCEHGSCSVENLKPVCSCHIGYSGSRCNVSFLGLPTIYNSTKLFCADCTTSSFSQVFTFADWSLWSKDHPPFVPFADWQCHSFLPSS